MHNLVLTLALLANESAYDREIAAALEDVRSVYEVPAALVKAVIRQESGFDPNARSHAGALGLMQVMPYNAAVVGMSESDLLDPAKNILAGVRILAELLRHYQGELVDALVAYNAGPRRPFAPIPKNGETPKYVERVVSFFRKYSAEASRAEMDQ